MKAKEFAGIARKILAPVYPLIADQILKETGITKGFCIDLGSGAGNLGLALAELSELTVSLLDKEQKMLDIAWQNIQERNLEKRVKTLLADISDLPIKENSVRLAVSRGSLFFWEEPVKAFNEIYRVLAPGGAAVIGGGFGNQEIKRQVDREMREINDDWNEIVLKRIGPGVPDKWRKVLSKTAIPDFDIEQTPVSMWIKFVK